MRYLGWRCVASLQCKHNSEANRRTAMKRNSGDWRLSLRGSSSSTINHNRVNNLLQKGYRADWSLMLIIRTVRAIMATANGQGWWLTKLFPPFAIFAVPIHDWRSFVHRLDWRACASLRRIINFKIYLIQVYYLPRFIRVMLINAHILTWKARCDKCCSSR